MNPIRTLTAREIECRQAMIKKNGVQLLLYKDARCDMAILDETFGPMNWMRHHTRDNANCIISIWDEDKGQWVDKEDVGTESNTEAQKGLASDSFKRAGVNWGIGRELYTSPFIWISNANCEIKEDQQGRLRCNDRFEVKEIGYNEHREIERLVIVNSKTKNVVFTYGTSPDARKGPSRPTSTQPKESVARPQKTADRPQRSGLTQSSQQMATSEQKTYIIDHASDEDYMAIMQKYGAELETLTEKQADAVIKKLADKAKAAEIPLSTTVTCERCGNPITGQALPDGTLMSASEIIGKSKVQYNGVYCFNCCKELKAARKAG